MRRLAAILLLSLLLFNLVGYRFWFSYVQDLADTHLQASLNKDNYNDQDLIIIKAPLTLPYQNDWAQFERVDGEITIGSKIYKFVKRKVVNGEMVLLCLPNEKKMRLETAKESFFQLASNLTTDNQAAKNSISVNYGKFQAQPVVKDDQFLYQLFLPTYLQDFCSVSKTTLTTNAIQPPTPPPNFL